MPPSSRMSVRTLNSKRSFTHWDRWEQILRSARQFPTEGCLCKAWTCGNRKSHWKGWYPGLFLLDGKASCCLLGLCQKETQRWLHSCDGSAAGSDWELASTGNPISPGQKDSCHPGHLLNSIQLSFLDHGSLQKVCMYFTNTKSRFALSLISGGLKTPCSI